MSQLKTSTLRNLGLSLFCATLITSGLASAAPSQSESTEVKPASPSVAPSANSTARVSSASDGKKKKSTELNFDDVLVYGKYHFSDEAVTTVEEDKVLDALLGVRTDFKDRMKKSAARH